jgi:hypothetical protein
MVARPAEVPRRDHGSSVRARPLHSPAQRYSALTWPQLVCRVGTTPQLLGTPGVGGQPVPTGCVVPA